MKDFEDMTLKEREEILEQLRNLPDESSGSNRYLYTFF